MTRPIIAILRGIKPVEAAGIGTTLCDAGISVIEVPLNSPDPFDSISILAETCAGRATVGAGTVLTPDDVTRVRNAGGQLIVSPDTNPDVIRATKDAGLQSWPGVMTPTEAFAALRAGADGLKLFPGEVIGPKGLKAMAAVLPKDVPLYAVGGVTADNVADWASAGAAGFGIGSSIYRPGDDAATVARKTAMLVSAVHGVGK